LTCKHLLAYIISVDIDKALKALADPTRRRLEDSNLVATTRRGREKLHCLNPVPIHEIHERQHLDALRDLKNRRS